MARVSDTPPTTTVVVAWMVVVPVVGELMTTVHEPVVPTVVQLVGPTKAAVAPPALVRLKPMVVPAGALAKPAAAGVDVDVAGQGVVGADRVDVGQGADLRCWRRRRS